MEAEVTSIVAPADGSTRPDGAELRGRLRSMWAAVAGAWEEHADYVDTRGAELTERMLELAALQPGERVLELASGAGGLGLAAAERVGPEGEVVVSDVVAEMVEIAAVRAARRGLANVTTRVLDLESIDEPGGSYDVVLCREGLMFAPDPARAARELRRVLRPGGRAAVAVLGPRARNPWLGIVFDAVGEQVGAPMPPPGIPGPFSLGDAERLARLLRQAGLSDVAVVEVPVPARADSFEEWWSRTSALAGPLAQKLASLPEPAVEALRQRLRELVAPYKTSTGLEFPGVSLLAGGRR